MFENRDDNGVWHYDDRREMAMMATSFEPIVVEHEGRILEARRKTLNGHQSLVVRDVTDRAGEPFMKLPLVTEVARTSKPEDPAVALVITEWLKR